MTMGGEEMDLTKVETQQMLTELIRRCAVSYLAIDNGSRVLISREGQTGQYFDGPGMVMYYKEPTQEEILRKLAEGKVSVNDARKALGLEPIDGGDVQLTKQFLSHVQKLENDSRW